MHTHWSWRSRCHGERTRRALRPITAFLASKLPVPAGIPRCLKSPNHLGIPTGFECRHTERQSLKSNGSGRPRYAISDLASGHPSLGKRTMMTPATSDISSGRSVRLKSPDSISST